MSPPVFLIPTNSADLSLTLQGNEGSHFITRKEFEQWSKTHPSLRPNSGSASASGTSDGGATTPTLPTPLPSSSSKGYCAPKHPASHVLHSIPPRAPSRSSRSGILNYTLHLAISTRLAAYASVTSSSSMFAPTAEDSAIDEKAAGLYKLSTSLLRSNRREGALPLSVERRVSLAMLVEELLCNPDPTMAAIKVALKDVRNSKEVESVQALQPLTSPESTTLYPAGVLAASSSAVGSATSVAQSLIDMKFGSGGDPEPEPTEANNAKNLASLGRESETVFGSSSGSQLTATPHMDYRIVRGQAMRARAKEIFATSILPSTTSIWCRRHRLASCGTCGTTTGASTPMGPPSRRTVPGQGLERVTDGTKRPLIELIPAFLDFSASLLKDLRDRASASDSEESEYTVPLNDEPLSISVTASWYSLLHSFLIQACLEGYLVDGWTGTSAIETIFGCGCGVWEGRGWASRVAQSVASAGSVQAKSVNGGDDDSDSESDSDSDSEEEELAVKKEKDRNTLIEAAQLLFGSRDVAQADFERNMRDRTHEFLNVPEDGSLEFHLIRLNAKYPLSSFENDMVEFIEATTKLFGKPRLAKYESVPVPAGQLPSGDADPFALTRYFSRTEQSDPPHRASDSVGIKGKRRRVD
ncbi:hypothetical protein T439DRAFT_320926 [Meredithblackwellia eburnea MCA 4105]